MQGHTNEPQWKIFKLKQIFDAKTWAKNGGIALHLSGSWTPPGRKNPCPCAHLFGPDREILTKAAESLGQKARWIQYPRNPEKMHFDLWGQPLEKAKRKCINYDEFST